MTSPGVADIPAMSAWKGASLRAWAVQTANVQLAGNTSTLNKRFVTCSLARNLCLKSLGSRGKNKKWTSRG